MMVPFSSEVVGTSLRDMKRNASSDSSEMWPIWDERIITRPALADTQEQPAAQACSHHCQRDQDRGAGLEADHRGVVRVAQRTCARRTPHAQPLRRREHL